MICMTLESKVEGLSIKRVVAHAVMPEMVLSEVSGTTGMWNESSVLEREVPLSILSLKR